MNADDATALLRDDPLRHIVTLKMLTHCGEEARLRLASGAAGWALLTVIPARASVYDARTYGSDSVIALLDGTSGALKLGLMEDLPRGNVVLKSYDASITDFAVRQLGARPVRSFVSFTSDPDGDHAFSSGIVASSALPGEVADRFQESGYAADELEHHFREQARWFGVRRNGRIVSACFVYRNFETVWEIAALFTEASHRRQGLAARVVSSAVGHLVREGCLPRYQVEASNVASANLARGIGLREFLRVEHLLITVGARSAAGTDGTRSPRSGRGPGGVRQLSQRAARSPGSGASRRALPVLATPRCRCPSSA